MNSSMTPPFPWTGRLRGKTRLPFLKNYETIQKRPDKKMTCSVDLKECINRQFVAQNYIPLKPKGLYRECRGCEQGRTQWDEYLRSKRPKIKFAKRRGKPVGNRIPRTTTETKERIREMLLSGNSYNEIISILHITSQTIKKVKDTIPIEILPIKKSVRKKENTRLKEIAEKFDRWTQENLGVNYDYRRHLGKGD